MEIMEDGNLVDRVRILLQRDMQYYQDMQTVLREPLCVRVSGGRFDFPRHASFASIKIISWWEAEFTETFGHPSGLSCPANSTDSTQETSNVELNGENEAAAVAAVDDTVDGVAVKKIQPSEFILMVVETSEQLLEHLHTLIQESLDHADLTVLTATLGAAALVRNCLWCYNRRAKGKIPENSSAKLRKFYDCYNEMTEAVAERLLDLHNRLIALYILMEADSLNWESDQPFFEKERSSYVIQMWWLYMQGTKSDLWNTVSPKMAQRVFAGMLNESLTIMAARFIHGRPSYARSMQFWVDAFNVLCCTAQLALGICSSGDEMIGLKPEKQSVYARDIHAKCNEVLICLLLRGAPLKVLFQVFRRGLDDLTISKPRQGPAPWLYVSSPDLFGVSHDKSIGYQPLTKRQAAILEFNVMRSHPQPNWPQLIKLLSMDDYLIAKTVMSILVRQCAGHTSVHELPPTIIRSPRASPNREINATGSGVNVENDEDGNCGGFLCNGKKCKRVLAISPAMALHALTYIVASIGSDPVHVLLPVLKKDEAWSSYLDRHQVWNQSRPPWLNALLVFLRPIMTPIVDTLLEAVKTGASTYQAMSLALVCFDELHGCLPINVLRIALAMDENVPAHCRPIGGSVVLQLMCSALYSALLEVKDDQSEVQTASRQREPDVVDDETAAQSFDTQSRSATALALSEAICSIDEDNKHTAQIDDLLCTVRETVQRKLLLVEHEQNVEDAMCIIKLYTDRIAFTETGRSSLKIAHEYLLRTSEALLDILLNESPRAPVPDSLFLTAALLPRPTRPLTYSMFHVGDKPFDRLLFDYDATIDWELMFEIPLAVTVRRVKSQVLARPELVNVLQLTEQDEREAAHFVKQLCTTGQVIRRN